MHVPWWADHLRAALQPWHDAPRPGLPDAAQGAGAWRVLRKVGVWPPGRGQRFRWLRHGRWVDRDIKIIMMLRYYGDRQKDEILCASCRISELYNFEHLSFQPIARRKRSDLTVGTPAWTASSRPQNGAPAPKLVAWACPPGSPTRTVGVRWWSRPDYVWSDPAPTSWTGNNSLSSRQRFFFFLKSYEFRVQELESLKSNHIILSSPAERQQVPEGGAQRHGRAPLL